MRAISFAPCALIFLACSSDPVTHVGGPSPGGTGGAVASAGHAGATAGKAGSSPAGAPGASGSAGKAATAGGSGGGAEQACLPGQTVVCGCVGTIDPGTEICAADGSGFGACSCPGSKGGAAGASGAGGATSTAGASSAGGAGSGGVAGGGAGAGGGGPQLCKPGEQAVCWCGMATTCKPDGSGFDLCECKGAEMCGAWVPTPGYPPVQQMCTPEPARADCAALCPGKPYQWKCDAGLRRPFADCANGTYTSGGVNHYGPLCCPEAACSPPPDGACSDCKVNTQLCPVLDGCGKTYACP